jgi:thymidine kinase
MPKKKRGIIEIIRGPMFAGKTTEWLRRLKDAYHCLAIKAAIDTRFNTPFIRTHDGVVATWLPTFTVARLADMDPKRIASVQVIGIDEGQFFPDLKPMCMKWAEAGKRVIVAGLDLDFQKQPFEPMAQLAAMTPCITSMKAKCHICEKPASFTQLFKPTQTKDQILVGGSELYRPVCAQHFALPNCD